MINSTLLLLFNVLFFQFAWFSLVLGYLELGIVFSMLLVIQVWITAENKKNEILFYIFIVVLGVISDSLLMNYQVYIFPLDSDNALHNKLAPIWLVILWLVFSLTLNRSLKWLLSMPILFIILLTLFGPLSYFAGSQLNPDKIQITLSIFYWSFLQWFLMGIFILFSRQLLLLDKQD